MSNDELFAELEARGENDRFFIPLDDTCRCEHCERALELLRQRAADPYCCTTCRAQERE